MAKLRDIEWSRENEAGDNIEFTSTVTVNGDGIFYMSIPEYLVPIMKSLQEKAVESWIGYDERVVRHSRGKFRVIGRSHKECVDLIGAGLDEFLVCEITRVPVIAYTFISTCHYGKDSQGNIWANGYDDQGVGMDGFRWADQHGKKGGYYAINTPYVVGFRAEVVTKVLAERKCSSKITYEPSNKEELGEWGKKLRRFNHTKLDFENSQELPYTEETAKFFYQSMLSLCVLTDKLAAVLSVPENILEHILIPALSAGEGSKH